MADNRIRWYPTWRTARGKRVSAVVASAMLDAILGDQIVQVGANLLIPNGAPLANYRFYIQKVWELIERAK